MHNKTDSNKLNVWYGNSIVGILWRDSTGNLGFQYDNTWLEHGFAISQQLPLSSMPYEPTGNKANQFFVNLLPEAGARIHIVRNLKITDSNFELLKAIGGECAGALSILSSNEAPQTEPSYKKLSPTELKKLLLRKGNTLGFTSIENRPKLSLAGAQDKCPIFFDGKIYYLPEKNSPSTHIIKFELVTYKNVPAYECFLSMLAHSIDLPIVPCELKKFEDMYYLLIKRYDRVINDAAVQRLHQEDFCQALGISYEKKYQQHGGPSLPSCYKLIQEISSQPIIDTENLLKWHIFNYLAGNSDGHAKNISILYDKNMRAKLAPFYDLVCTRAIVGVDTHLAMSIGEEFNPDNVTPNNWQQLAKSCDIGYQYLIRLIRQTSEKLIEELPKTKEQFEFNYGDYPALQRVQQVIMKQCHKTLKLLT